MKTSSSPEPNSDNSWRQPPHGVAGTAEAELHPALAELAPDASVKKGQYEAAAAMGLGYWRSTGLVILPQALKLVIPGIVNTFIALFKDTSLVIIIGLFDLLNSVKQAAADPKWLGMATEGYVFAALVFWIFCFGMSRYSMHLERKLDTGHKH